MTKKNNTRSKDFKNLPAAPASKNSVSLLNASIEQVRLLYKAPSYSVPCWIKSRMRPQIIHINML